jgi:catechol 2,3-dioxygenase-like lactoylglutathione lyase family enzyme
MPQVLETALYAADLDAAEAFYGGLLGLETVTRAGTRHVFFRLDRAMLLVFNPAATAIPPAEGALPVPPHGAVGDKPTSSRSTGSASPVVARTTHGSPQVDRVERAESRVRQDPSVLGADPRMTKKPLARLVLAERSGGPLHG